MYNQKFKDKKVLITGHTGFKGTWLTCWLLKLGAKVTGISDGIPTKPSMFEELSLENKIEHIICDIRDLDTLSFHINRVKPDYVFHLAAQPIVSESYKNPLDTITTNVVGTANILESLRNADFETTAVIITSDKCYENVEWEWGYKETDHLGGKDIYSGSKGAAEVIFHSYYESFFKNNEKIRLATGRAGNVIGGGDWAKDRIVVDCMQSWSVGEKVEIRSPEATRPWQHVLEPLSGYLTLAAKLSEDMSLDGQSFNFGPKSEQNRTVLQLLQDLGEYWNIDSSTEGFEITDNIPFHEAGLLKLNCDKSLFHLKWEANLYYSECVKLVAEWYYSFYKNSVDMMALTLAQIEVYENKAEERKLIWAS